MRQQQLIIVSAVVAPVLALLLHVSLHSPITPQPLRLPSSHIPPNNLLQGVDKLGEGILVGPEDVCVDGENMLYTATRDGWIKRMHPNDTWENWKMVGGPGVLGIALSAAGGLIVCDTDKGLIKVGEDGVTTLASEVADGTKIRFANEAIEASDGSVYFSDASSKFSLENWFLDVFEAVPHGRLLKYDPSNNKAIVVLGNLSFPNGVALSSNQDYLIVCETWKFRCLKHWLAGELRGATEVFIENLPGAPDNINLAPDGSYWIALIQLRSRWLDAAHRSSFAKRVLASFPKFMEIVRPMTTRGTVIKVGADGKIVRVLDDYNGRVMSFVTSAVEHKGHLYLGSLQTNFIGRLIIE